MAPSFKRGLFTSVLTALGTTLNNSVDSTSTLLGSALSVLGTENAEPLVAFLTDNVSRRAITYIDIQAYSAVALTKWLSMGR